MRDQIRDIFQLGHEYSKLYYAILLDDNVPAAKIYEIKWMNHSWTNLNTNK